MQKIALIALVMASVASAEHLPARQSSFRFASQNRVGRPLMSHVLARVGPRWNEKTNQQEISAEGLKELVAILKNPKPPLELDGIDATLLEHAAGNAEILKAVLESGMDLSVTYQKYGTISILDRLLYLNTKRVERFEILVQDFREKKEQGKVTAVSLTQVEAMLATAVKAREILDNLPR